MMIKACLNLVAAFCVLVSGTAVAVDETGVSLAVVGDILARRNAR